MYFSKITFYQICDCISLKALDTGSLQIFKNPCKFACQLCQKKFKKCLSNFLGKMSLPQTKYFSISNFLYKLTQPTVHQIASTKVYSNIPDFTTNVTVVV